MALTLITLFNSHSQNKLDKLLSHITEPVCRVPFGRVPDRLTTRDLPHHFTLSAWKSSQREQVLQGLAGFRFRKLTIWVDDIDIMFGKEESYVLYFSIRPSDALVRLQQQLYSLLPNPRCIPGSPLHMTLCIDKDYHKVCAIKDRLDPHFKPFPLRVNALQLYEIYPAVPLLKIPE